MDDTIEDANGSGSAARDWAIVYQRHQRQVFQQCLAQLKNHADAEDAVQEAFLRAGSRLVKVSSDPSHYVSVVARNVCRDELRRRSRHRTGPVSEAHTDHATSGGNIEADYINRADIQRGWAGLSGRERSLVSRTFAGFSRTETAVTMRMTTGAVTVALGRARHRVSELAQVSR